MTCSYCKNEEKDCICCCRAECPHFDEGECEGPVEVVDEEYNEDDYWWIHRCAKHAKTYFERGY